MVKRPAGFQPARPLFALLSGRLWGIPDYGSPSLSLSLKQPWRIDTIDLVETPCWSKSTANTSRGHETRMLQAFGVRQDCGFRPGGVGPTASRKLLLCDLLEDGRPELDYTYTCF